MSRLFVFLSALVANPNVTFCQATHQVQFADSIIYSSESSQSAITNKKCDSTFRTGSSRRAVKNSISCIVFKEDLVARYVRIEEVEQYSESCSERYTYYFYNKRLIKVVAEKGNNLNNLLVESMIYYDLDRPVYEIQKRIELTPEYPIQRAYELLSFVSK